MVKVEQEVNTIMEAKVDIIPVAVKVIRILSTSDTKILDPFNNMRDEKTVI